MDYRTEVLRTVNPTIPHEEQLLNAVLGLCGESGEVADLLKKAMFQGKDVKREVMLKELGDVRWYLELACFAVGTTMTEVEELNVAKLRARYPNGFSTQDSEQRVDTKPSSIILP